MSILALDRLIEYSPRSLPVTILSKYFSMAQVPIKRQRRFAPLDPQLSEKSNTPRLKGIVFDVDGTLWFVLDPEAVHGYKCITVVRVCIFE